MSIIQRPGKEGNATTYQGKVAAGYTKILASEVDADIDTIFSAWNAGVDTVNIKDGAVTTPKIGALQVVTGSLADGSVTQSKLAAGVTAIPSGNAGGDLGGMYPNPTLVNVHSGALQFTPRGNMNAGPTYYEVQANPRTAPNYDGAKPTWFVRLDYTGDNFEVWRSPDGATGFVRILSATGRGGSCATSPTFR